MAELPSGVPPLIHSVTYTVAGKGRVLIKKIKGGGNREKGEEMICPRHEHSVSLGRIWVECRK